MDGTRGIGVILLAMGAAAACGDRPAAEPEPASAVVSAPGIATAGSPEAPGADAPVAEEQRLPEPPADHRPTGAADRALLSGIYLAFAVEPAGFADKVAALTPEQRRQTWGFLFCAAPRMLAAGQEGERHGAPVNVELPPAADELIEYQGPHDRARRTLLRQLAGEFVVVGRCIQSIDEGERRVVDGILARQAKNLEMMRATSGAGQSEKWEGRVRRVFPVLFAALLPGC
jgi:hypothetical protein